MKKSLLILLLLPALIIAQQEKINFTHKLSYEFNEEYGTKDIDLYFSPNGSVLEIYDVNILLKDQLSLLVKIGLDGVATFPVNVFADSISSFTLQKTNKGDNANGISCNYYDFLVVKQKREQIKMCIAENNPIDMLASLPVINKNIKGLIVKIIVGEKESYELKSINKINSSISIDWQKTSARVKEQLNERKTYVVDSIDTSIDYEDYEDYEDEDYEDEDYDINIPDYNSEYKISNLENTNLAVDQLEIDSPYWDGLPVYCKELDQKVSIFKNSSLREHARNYAGQLCDLYLSEIIEYSFDVKGTLDQIRYEENYFRNTVFDKTDRKILDSFLNELD
ncbi:hypothetical protein [Apibacter sp. HY039]|uniref:hypothetical protein n=1 Tax=Apibacter sp. HY039 TaxID=2501476 RepID=UPI000FEBA899|nr:hypothetical protein [Apibacter sp. HY039]